MAALKSYVRLVNVPDWKKLWEDWGTEGGYGNPVECTMDLAEVSQEVVRMAAGRPHQIMRISRLLGTNREEVQLRTPTWCLAGDQAIRKFAGGLVAGEQAVFYAQRKRYLMQGELIYSETLHLV